MDRIQRGVVLLACALSLSVLPASAGDEAGSRIVLIAASDSGARLLIDVDIDGSRASFDFGEPLSDEHITQRTRTGNTDNLFEDLMGTAPAVATEWLSVVTIAFDDGPENEISLSEVNGAGTYAVDAPRAFLVRAMTHKSMTVRYFPADGAQKSARFPVAGLIDRLATPAAQVDWDVRCEVGCTVAAVHCDAKLRPVSRTRASYCAIAGDTCTRACADGSEARWDYEHAVQVENTPRGYVLSFLVSTPYPLVFANLRSALTEWGYKTPDADKSEAAREMSKVTLKHRTKLPPEIDGNLFRRFSVRFFPDGEDTEIRITAKPKNHNPRPERLNVDRASLLAGTDAIRRAAAGDGIR